jgi:hypothetical protein
MEMDINSPVIVTALYNIGRDEWDKFTQSYDGYLQWLYRTLSLDSNIIIYTQERFKDQILDYRSKYDNNLEKTHIVIQELEDIYCYKKYNQPLEDLMYSDEFKKKLSFPDVPEASRPLYNVIMFNKVFWLRHAVENNIFNNDMVLWLDAGGLRDNIEKYENVNWPSLEQINKQDTNRVTFFSHKLDFTITDEEREYISLSQIRAIQGTAFLVPSHLIYNLCDEVEITINNSLRDKYIGSDEKIFDITYVRDKSKYSLIESDWREYFERLHCHSESSIQ